MSTPLIIHPSAQDDLRSIKGVDRVAAARITTAIRTMKDDKDLQAVLLDRSALWGDYDIQKWVSQQRRGNNLWRLKIWETEEQALSYRIIYAFQPVSASNPRPCIFVLAVFHRTEFDYDNTPRTAGRVLTDYDGL